MNKVGPISLESILLPTPIEGTPPDWGDLFADATPVEVDAGCGKGRFLAAHAARHPDHKFLGIDKKPGRIRKTGSKIVRAGLSNVRLLHMEIADAVMRLPSNSISTLYLFFPDPWPKRRHHSRRLFDQEFALSVAGILIPGGTLHMATDDMSYAEQIAASIKGHPAFDSIPALELPDDEKTDFERLFLQMERRIARFSFVRNSTAVERPVASPNPTRIRRTFRTVIPQPAPPLSSQ